MYAIKRILVTTDFSDYSATALEHALLLADVHRAEVHLLHVIDDTAGNVNDRQERARQSMQKFIFEKVDEMRTITRVLRVGHPHREITRYAKESAIDLIVIATHGRTGLAHVLVGSVAENVIRHTSVPVLTVRPAAVLETIITSKDVEEELHMPNTRT